MSDESAFPRVKSDRFDGAECVSDVWSEGGLSKRELFAAMAMQGFISSGQVRSKEDVEGLGFMALRAADSLLAELAKESK
jgi:hypothetical protein